MADMFFQTLDVKINEQGKEFHDHGYVPSIRRFIRSVHLQEGASKSIAWERSREYPIVKYAKGMSVGFDWNEHSLDRHVFHIALHKSLENNPYATLFSGAHEETHSLHGLDLLSHLQDKFDEHKIHIDLSSYPAYTKASAYEKELVAYFGSLYAVSVQGYPIERASVVRGWLKHEPYFHAEHAAAMIDAHRIFSERRGGYARRFVNMSINRIQSLLR